MPECKVAVLGASSLVGECLLSLLTQANWHVNAYSRQVVRQSNDRVAWRCLPLSNSPSFRPPLPQGETNIPLWISVAPIWVLPSYFAFLEAHGVKRIVVLSSTSRFTKDNSSDLQEQIVARRLAEAEASVQAWAEDRGVEWVILRPTLIYGMGRDKNITEIVRFVRRFGFFPLFGQARGLRQPIHAQDVATACIAALEMPGAVNRAYNISGSEAISYREMITRVFAALGRPLRLLPVPLSAFRVAVAVLNYWPHSRGWSVAMAERMNTDMVFDHSEAACDFGFEPRMFVLSSQDIAM